MKTFAAITIFFAVSQFGCAEEEKKAVSIMPLVATEFGKIIEIEGKIVDDTDTRLRSHLGKTLIEVDRVGDATLPKPVVIELVGFSVAKVEIPARGTRVRFRGYESGSFVGNPQRAFDDIPRVATTEHHFESNFQITARLSKIIAESGPRE